MVNGEIIHLHSFVTCNKIKKVYRLHERNGFLPAGLHLLHDTVRLPSIYEC
jgi:hypothetical protein